MGILRYDVDRPSGVVLVYEAGVITLDEILSLVKRVDTDPAVPRPVRQLVDLRDVERLDLDFPDTGRVRDAALAVVGDGPPALVAELAPADHQYGACRQLQSLAEGSSLQVEIFRDLEGAARCVGIDPQRARELLEELRSRPGPERRPVT